MRAKEMVRAGYNAIAPAYLAARAKDSQDMRFLLDLVWRLPRGARVLDAGCGAGLPVTMQLGRYFDVVGVDLAEGQLQLARRAVPGAQFACQDMAQLAFADACFDAVCSYYAIIHVPRAEHREVVANFHRVLRPGGLLLACMGSGDLPESIEECHGKPMYWSHFDAPANLAILEDGEFSIEWQKTVPDATYPGGSHLFVLARRR